MKAGSNSGSRFYAPFSALYVVMNERNQVVSYRFVHTKGADEVIPVLEGLKKRYELQVLSSRSVLAVAWLIIVSCGQKWTPPAIVYSDNCCADRTAIQKVFPHTTVTDWSVVSVSV